MPETVQTAPREINGDPAFPIYSITLEYEYEDPDDGVQTRGQNTEMMFREEVSVDTLLDKIVENFEHNKDVRIRGEGPHDAGEYVYLYEPVSPFRFKVERFYYETWSLRWFGHKTFPLGRSDEELLACFQRYVNRHARHADTRHYDYDNPPIVHTFEDVEVAVEVPARSTLMGAEDRWRWHGTKDGDPKDGERTDPPCRCPHCKEQGVVRISH